jgi:hypothetical protein
MPKSLADKLRLLPGKRGLVLSPPPAYLEQLGSAAPVDLQPHQPPYDVVQLFVTGAGDLQAQLAAARPVLGPAAILWVTYPKLTSKAAGELNRDVLYGLMQEQGFQAVAQIAVDETWSAMRSPPEPAPARRVASWRIPAFALRLPHQMETGMISS